MFRRLPTFLSLTFATTLGLFALTSVLTAQQPPAPGATAGGAKRTQEENLKFYKNFAEQVLRLAQKWEKSELPEDKERAKVLRRVLKMADEKGVEKLFKELIEGLNGQNTDFGGLGSKDKKLVDALNEILVLLQTEDDDARLKIEIEKLKDQIKAITDLKRKQENLVPRTINPRSDLDKIAKEQKDLKEATDKVAKAMNKDPNAKSGAGGAKEDPKSENKPETKPGESAAEDKPDTKESKADGKPNDGMGMGMPMEPKGGSEAKPMGGMGMPMAGGDKPSPKDPMAGDPKGGEPKPMGATPPKDPMGGEPKPADAKPQGSGKGDPKPSAGMPGGDAKPMPPSDGMGGMSPPSPGAPKPGGQPSPGGSPPPPNGAKKDPAQEAVEQAVPNQQDAENEIKKNDPKEATKKQDEAIKKLEEAIKELEARLKQLREKELAKLLANLEERVTRMLRMQTEVKAATEAVDNTVKKLGGGKPAVAEIQKSQTEADNESKIIALADATLKLMEGEGSAVVFAGVLKEVRGDMEAIQKRLNEARVGADTQQIEQDVIDQLKLMQEALKKAKQDLENKPPEGKPGDPPPPANKKLLELLAELKLVKAQQEQVNKRTIMYNKQDPGEQAKDPLIQAELAQLAARQKVLQDMIHKIATQANQ